MSKQIIFILDKTSQLLYILTGHSGNVTVNKKKRHEWMSVCQAKNLRFSFSELGEVIAQPPPPLSHPPDSSTALQL